MRRLAALAASSVLAVTVAGAVLAGGSGGTASAGVRIPSRAAVGNHAVCHQTRRARSCVTRGDNGVTGTRNRLYFRNGINAYGGYWTIQKIGNVSNSWPFKYQWANTRWHGWAVVNITSFTFGNQYAAGKCETGAHITLCNEAASSKTYWIEVEKKKAWHFISVRATDDLYPIVGRRTSYALQYNGVNRIAITAPNTGSSDQTFALPGV